MKHPYIGLPDYQFWKREEAIAHPERLRPVTVSIVRIEATDRIVTAGSCFAQHVARYLSKSGFDHHITETAHAMFTSDVARAHHYGMFSARYGNVYTARQLRQLLLRAFGQFEPIERAWRASAGTMVDPFRPQIQPGGYVDVSELEADRHYHLSCVRRSILEMDVFVFTLGLTECWADARDGAVFPIAPGVAGGTFDPSTCVFENFDEAETYADLAAAIDFIREINPAVKIILTVSPVPLNATYVDRHVLLSTTWSKSVLRVAAEKAARQYSACTYFPSYEIITSPFVRGQYFGPDCREIEAAGVDHVMGVFFEAFSDAKQPRRKAEKRAKRDAHGAKMKRAMAILCDEEALTNV